MKKINSILVVLAIVITMIAGCTGSTEKKAINEGKRLMENGEYETALSYLNIAKSEGNDNAEVEEMILIIDNYIKSLDAFDEANMEEANDYINAIPENYKNYSISADVENLKNNISAKQTIMADIDSQISGTKQMVAVGDYVSAEANVKELYVKEMTEYQKKQVDEINATIQSAKSKIDEASNKEANIVYVPQTSTSSNVNVVDTYYVVNCKESITLRTAPSTSASEIVQIPLGQAVGYIENAGNGFYKINYDGRVGYSLASYLSSTKPLSNNIIEAQVVNCNEWITLRKTPSTSAESLARIPLGAYVKYISNADNGFYCIEYNGQVGYALQSYLELK